MLLQKKERGHVEKSTTGTEAERSACRWRWTDIEQNDPERVGMKEVPLKTERSRRK